MSKSSNICQTQEGLAMPWAFNSCPSVCPSVCMSVRSFIVFYCAKLIATQSLVIVNNFPFAKLNCVPSFFIVMKLFNKFSKTFFLIAQQFCKKSFVVTIISFLSNNFRHNFHLYIFFGLNVFVILLFKKTNKFCTKMCC